MVLLRKLDVFRFQSGSSVQILSEIRILKAHTLYPPDMSIQICAMSRLFGELRGKIKKAGDTRLSHVETRTRLLLRLLLRRFLGFRFLRCFLRAFLFGGHLSSPDLFNFLYCYQSNL